MAADGEGQIVELHLDSVKVRGEREQHHPDGTFRLTDERNKLMREKKNGDICVIFQCATFCYMFKAELVALVSLKVPSGWPTNGAHMCVLRRKLDVPL